jgi:hypothetical protein
MYLRSYCLRGKAQLKNPSLRGNVTRGNVFSRRCVLRKMFSGDMVSGGVVVRGEMAIRGNVPNPNVIICMYYKLVTQHLSIHHLLYI